MNDLTIIIIIVSVFLALGILMPYVNQALGESYSGVNTDTLKDNVGLSAGSESEINTWNVALSVMGMFFWSFGQIPWFLDTLLLIPRIILVVAFARLIRGVG